MPHAPTPQVIASFADLRRVLGASDIDQVSEAVEALFDFDGEVLEGTGTFTPGGDVLDAPDGIEIRLGMRGIFLSYPFSLDDVRRVVVELEEAFDGEIEELP